MPMETTWQPAFGEAKRTQEKERLVQLTAEPQALLGICIRIGRLTVTDC